ncbi:hypothetical protein [Neobacillus sp. FSL H8-0543]|uniref:hypothetical protein n=1 Tax=Neobacillus sp. FSL H8-0543 TaxID=2954672 RepID=UPI0031584771
MPLIIYWPYSSLLTNQILLVIMQDKQPVCQGLFSEFFISLFLGRDCLDIIRNSRSLDYSSSIGEISSKEQQPVL